MDYRMGRPISAIVLLSLLLGVGLGAPRNSVVEQALAEPQLNPLAEASWSANVRVKDYTGLASQEEPAIAVDPAGNAYAVWADRRTGDSDIWTPIAA